MEEKECVEKEEEERDLSFSSAPDTGRSSVTFHFLNFLISDQRVCIWKPLITATDLPPLTMGLHPHKRIM